MHTHKSKVLDGANKYECSKCGVKTCATKRLSLHRLPAVLQLHLNRFETQCGGHSAKKVLCVRIYIYICMCVCVCVFVFVFVYVCIYIHIYPLKCAGPPAKIFSTMMPVPWCIYTEILESKCPSIFNI